MSDYFIIGSSYMIDKWRGRIAVPDTLLLNDKPVEVFRYEIQPTHTAYASEIKKTIGFRPTWRVS